MSPSRRESNSKKSRWLLTNADEGIKHHRTRLPLPCACTRTSPTSRAHSHFIATIITKSNSNDNAYLEIRSCFLISSCAISTAVLRLSHGVSLRRLYQHFFHCFGISAVRLLQSHLCVPCRPGRDARIRLKARQARPSGGFLSSPHHTQLCSHKRRARTSSYDSSLEGISLPSTMNLPPTVA